MAEHPAIVAARRAVTQRRGLPPIPSGTRAIGAKCYPLEVPSEIRRVDGVEWHALNPGIAQHGDRTVVCVRLNEPPSLSTKSRTAVAVGCLDGDYRLRDARLQRDDRPDRDRTLYHEDMRLISVGDRLMAVSSVCDRVHPPQIAVMGLSDDGADVAWMSVQPSPYMQKNWMPATIDGALGFVYSIDPLKVLSFDMGSRQVVPPSQDLPQLLDGRPRGGSPLMQFEGGWLAVVHEVYLGPSGLSAYLHRFVRFDAGLTRAVRGPLWYFRHVGIEFCSGLCVHGDRLLLSFGHEDRQALLAVMNEDTLRPYMPRI